MSRVCFLYILVLNSCTNLTYASDNDNLVLLARSQAPLTDRESVLKCFKTLPSSQDILDVFSSFSPEIFSNDSMYKRNNAFIKIQNSDPMYVALGMWRACQEYEFYRVHNQKKYTPRFFLKMGFNPEIVHSNDNFTIDDFSIITKLVIPNPYFTTIDLFNCKVFDSIAGKNRLLNDKDIKFFLKIPHLTTLKLKQTDVDMSCSYFVTHQSLTWLEVEHSQVNDKGLQFLRENSKLRVLNLSNNEDITEQGILSLATGKMRNLRDLRLINTRVTNDCVLALLTKEGLEAALSSRGLKPLASDLKALDLETLDLSYNPLINDEVGDVILKYVQKNPKVTGFKLSKTSISIPQIDAIYRALSNNKDKALANKKQP